MLTMRLCFATFGEIIFSVISVMPMEFKSIIREFYIYSLQICPSWVTHNVIIGKEVHQ